MIDFKEEIKELVRISGKIASYENTQEEYKIVPLADLLLTISNSIKNKYNKKYPGRLNNVNKDIHMEKFEDSSKGNFIRLKDSGLDLDVPEVNWEGYFLEDEDFIEEKTENKVEFENKSNKVEFENKSNKAENENKVNKVEFENKVNIETEIEQVETLVFIEEDVIENYDEFSSEDLSNSNEMDVIENSIENSDLEKENNIENSKENQMLEYINNLNFLYKPIDKNSYLEGNYMSKFGIERDSDLNKSKTMENHNKFWSANSVEHGNIFGSVPIDLISERSASKLLSSGWRISEVNIYELKLKMDLWEVNNFCKKKFNDYLVVKELNGDSILIFEYKI